MDASFSFKKKWKVTCHGPHTLGFPLPSDLPLMQTALSHQVTFISPNHAVDLASFRFIHLQFISFHTWDVKFNPFLTHFHIARDFYSDFILNGFSYPFILLLVQKQKFLIFHKILEYYSPPLENVACPQETIRIEL